MKAGGRAGIVIKNTILSGNDNASVSLKKYLLESCDLHTILDLPAGTFIGAGVKTVILFFTKGKPTENIWYYQVNLSRKLGKNNPLNDDDLSEFKQLQKSKGISENSWSISVKELNNSLDLNPKNPNHKFETDVRLPNEILEEISEIDNETSNLLLTLNSIVNND